MIKHTFQGKGSRVDEPYVLPKALRHKAWLKWLTPTAKIKAVKKQLRKLALKGQLPKPHVTALVPNSAVVKKLKMGRYRFPRPDRPKNHATFVPKYRRGISTVTTRSGFTPTVVGTTVIQLIPGYDKADYLTRWSSVNGDRKRPNPFEFRRVVDGYYVGFVRTWDDYGNGNDSSTINRTGGAVTYDTNLLTYDPTTYNEALGRLYSSIRGDLDLAIDIAEAHQAKAMISKTLLGMRNLATTFRKMRRSNPKDWGNLWLEFTYGWKPLANSIYGLGRQVLQLDTSDPLSGRAVGSAKSTKRGVTTVGNGTSVVQERIQTDSSYRCRIVANFGFTQSALDSFASFSSLNPVSIAWELTPYSFVVDWFVDVGGYLRNFESALLYRTNFRHGYVSEGYKVVASGVRTQQSYSQTSPHSAIVESTSALGTATGFKRTILSSVPFPRAPRFDPKLGTYRLLSAAALLGQLLPDRGRRR